MSIGKRLLDLARANLNALLDKTSGDAALDDLSDEELEIELRRRKERKLRELAEQKSRESAERSARERAAERAAERASARARAPSRAASQKKISERRLRDLYAQLEVRHGAPFPEVKQSFRRLMRKYHPDLHVNDPIKHKTATQLTMSLTAAYNELERHLQGGT